MISPPHGLPSVKDAPKNKFSSSYGTAYDEKSKITSGSKCTVQLGLPTTPIFLRRFISSSLLLLFVHPVALRANPNITIITATISHASSINRKLGVRTKRIIVIRRNNATAMQRNTFTNHLDMMQLANRRSANRLVYYRRRSSENPTKTRRRCRTSKYRQPDRHEQSKTHNDAKRMVYHHPNLSESEPQTV